MTILLIVPFWLLIIRPQQQSRQAHRAFVAGLAPGERIEGFSGIHGTITEVGEETVEVEIAEGVVVTMARMAVSSYVGEDGARVPIDGGRQGREGERRSVEEPVNTAPDGPATPPAIEGEDR
jgi:preprotein translocase subunit YajC